MALFGLLGLLVLASPAAATGPSPESPRVSPRAGAPPRPELPRTEPAPTRTVTRTVAATPRQAPRAAAAPATVRTVVITPKAPRATAAPRRRSHATPQPRRHTPPQPARNRAPSRHRAARLPAPADSPPYGLVGLAALLAVLGAGSLAVTVSQLRAGAA